MLKGIRDGIMKLTKISGSSSDIEYRDFESYNKAAEKPIHMAIDAKLNMTNIGVAWQF